jgi:hypothetical protein
MAARYSHEVVAVEEEEEEACLVVVVVVRLPVMAFEIFQQKRKQKRAVTLYTIKHHYGYFNGPQCNKNIRQSKSVQHRQFIEFLNE